MKKDEIYNFWRKLEIPINIIDKFLTKITDKTLSQLFLLDDINDKYIFLIESFFSRYISWEPLEYILEKAEFFWFDFYVDSRCLIPRNDTEVMVEQVLKIKDNYCLIDVWTWSSCIPISILNNNTNISECFVIDLSKEALEVSKININKFGLGKKIIQVHSSLLDNFLSWNNKLINKTLVITANLPYVKDQDFENMSPETIEFEPDLALYWWKDTWFELYELLIEQCLRFKEKWFIIILFIEIWFDQKEYSNFFLNKLWLNFEYFKDNCWIDRCIKIFI